VVVEVGEGLAVEMVTMVMADQAMAMVEAMEKAMVEVVEVVEALASGTPPAVRG
jgi:hypothetical protein